MLVVLSKTLDFARAEIVHTVALSLAGENFEAKTFSNGELYADLI